MLPEFSDVYAHFISMVESAIADAHQKQLKASSNAKRRILYEGDDFERNSTQEDSNWKHFEETVVISSEEADSLSLVEIIGRFVEIGNSIGKQAEAHFQTVVRKHAEKTDQLVAESPDEELAETILRLLEKANLTGDTESFTVFCPPGREKEFQDAFKIINNTPHLAARKKNIEDAGFEKQRRLQANRKLVD